jgi:hypothetical protein
MKRITVDLPDEMYRGLKISCAMEDSRMADVIRQLLDGHLAASKEKPAIPLIEEEMKNAGPGMGLMYAENAIRQLEKISPRDPQLVQAYNFVIHWIEKKLETIKPKKK